MYRQLDSAKIIATAQTLANRMRERFPSAGLVSVADDLVAVSQDAAAIVESLGRPIVGLRILSMTIAGALVALLIVAAINLRVSFHVADAVQLAQGVESLVNDIVFGGVAIWFTFTIETRRKRSRALKLITQLRSLAHVIDMHQLNKDPGRDSPGYQPTASSPKSGLPPELLARYLDYCSEMLSILGKLAALCIQKFNDPVTLAAVNELEDLSSGLSRKIWQKIMILPRTGKEM